jgi:predicted glycosyltransferase
MKILMYCQYLLGVGHLMRSFNIAQNLSKNHKVCMLCGGEEIDEINKNSPFRIEWLEPILDDSKPSKAYIVDGKSNNFKSVIGRRLKKIRKRIDKLKPDIFWIEGFPFARRKYAIEILPSIAYAKQVNPNCKIVSSVRDILLGTSYDNAYKDKVVGDLNAFIDLLLIHGDPELFPFERTFGSMSSINPRYEYTGYVCRQVANSSVKKSWNDNGHITVNIGGSRFGQFILYKVLECHKQYMADRDIHIFLNVDGNEMDLRKIEGKNINIHTFSFDYINYLSTAAVSISMGGYNSVIESVITRTPSVVIPFDENDEQLTRARLFNEKFNIFEIIKSQDLTSETLFNAINRAAVKKVTEANVNLNGIGYLTDYFKRLSKDGPNG